MDDCYELVADRVDEASWKAFTKKLAFGFKGFPADWDISTELESRLLLKLQWTWFNPDLVEGPVEKRTRSWAFMSSFLPESFRRKFSFFRARLEKADMEKWDGLFADFETLLLLSSMTEEMQQEWLPGFDARVRYGKSRRAKVIKKKGLGLNSDVLGVNILMDWGEIRTRYRYLLKKHHPDVGGDPQMVRDIVDEFNRLSKAAGK